MSEDDEDDRAAKTAKTTDELDAADDVALFVDTSDDKETTDTESQTMRRAMKIVWIKWRHAPAICAILSDWLEPRSLLE
jgi:hypothetical protein